MSTTHVRPADPLEDAMPGGDGLVSRSTLHVVGIAGSLRAGSYNRAVLRAAAELAPAELRLVEAGIADVPHFDEDLEAEGDPPAVAELKRAVDAADGVVIVTPEYQHGVPGVLKNVIDWLSRPPGRAPLLAKPVAVLGASPGMVGTARAQIQLRQTLFFNGCPVLPPPEVLIAQVHEKVRDGRLVDEVSRRFVADQMTRFAGWIRIFADR